MSAPPAILTALVCLLPLSQGSPQFTTRLRPSLRTSLRPPSFRSPTFHSSSLNYPSARSSSARSSSPIPSLRSLLSRLNRRPGQAGRPAAVKTRPLHQRQQVRRVARPLPAIAYLQAREIPGYQTFQLHHAIRRKEGTEIFEGGRKPEVIHYVSGPTIRTPDLSSKIDERSAGAGGIVAEELAEKVVDVVEKRVEGVREKEVVDVVEKRVEDVREKVVVDVVEKVVGDVVEKAVEKVVEDEVEKVVEKVVENVVEDVVEKVVENVGRTWGGEDVVVGRGLTRQPEGVVSTIQIYELSK